ncbi:hypothetical protein GCM10027051_31620 [Niabella terrae]
MFKACKEIIYGIFIFKLFLIASACNESDNPPINGNAVFEKKYDPIIIRANLKNEQVAAFFYLDEMGINVPPFFFTKKDSIKNIPTTEPLMLIDAIKQNIYIVFPGDVLELTLAKNRAPILKTKDSLRNNELDFFKEQAKNGDNVLETSLQLSLPNTKAISINNTPDINLTISNAAATHLKRLNFLQSYLMNKNMSSEFITFIKDLYVNFERIQILTPLKVENSASISLPKSFGKCVDSIITTTFSEENLTVGNRLLINYILTYYSNKYQQFSKVYDEIEKLPDNAQSRFLKFLLLKKKINGEYNQNRELYDKYINSRSDKYASYLSAGIKKLVAMNNADSKHSLIDYSGSIVSWHDIMEKNKGSYVFIDFWASWCAPCRKSFPEAKKMMTELEKKDINFLFISSDNDVGSWKKAVVDENLPTENCFLFTDFENSEIKEVFNIHAIPRYILLDSKGNILDDDAPHPGNLKLNELNKHL